MADVSVVRASVDDVRVVARRRRFDDAGIRLALELADRDGAWIARDDGETVGVVLVRAVEEERYLSDCFVEPSYRGQGIGARLAETAFAAGADGGEESGIVVKRASLDFADPAAMALALRHGLAARDTVLRFAGPVPREQELARMAAGNYTFAVAALDPSVHAFALNALDREARGASREVDHLWFARFTEGSAFFLNGEFVAYAYVWPDGRIGPLAAVSASYLVQILAYALVTLQRRHAVTWCTLLVPSTNLRIARTCLRAGLRIEETLLVASEVNVADLSTYVGYHRLLI